jgi:hypothetical protein
MMSDILRFVDEMGTYYSLGYNGFRPERPVFNSHVREGVEKNTSVFPGGPTGGSFVSGSRPGALTGYWEALIYALMAVAIESLPFRPESRR